MTIHLVRKPPPSPIVPRHLIYRVAPVQPFASVSRDWLFVGSEGFEGHVSRADIRAATLRVCGVELREFCSDARPDVVVLARQIFYFLCRVHTSASYPAIGAMAGGRDHTTVLYGATKVASRLDDFAERLAAVESAANLSSAHRNMALLGDYIKYFNRKCSSMIETNTKKVKP